MFRTVAPLLRPVQQHCRTSYAGAVDRHVQLNIRIAKMDTLVDVAQCVDLGSVDRNLGSMNVVNMVTCMHRAARHSSQDTKKATALIYRLANRLTAFMTRSGSEGIAELRPMSLSNAVWAIASVGGSTDWKIEVVAAMRTLITPHLLTTMKPQLLANIAWGIAKIHQQRKLQRHERCDPSSVAVIESIAQEVTRRGRGLRSWPELQPQNVSNIVWSFGVLLDADVVVVEAGLRELLVLQQALQPRARDIRAQHVNNTTWAIARLYSREADSLLPREVQEASDRLFDSATRRPSDFRPPDWANLSWSYAKLKDSHKQQIADCGIVDMAPEVFERRTGINAAGPRSVDLANILWAMAKLRLYSLKDFAERCVDRYLTEDRLWAECSAHHMSSLAICAEQMSLRNLEGVFDKIGGAIVEASHGFHRVDGPTIASLLPVFVTAGQHLRHERALLKLRSLCDSASLEPGELVIVNHALSQLPSRPELFRPIAWEDYSLTVMTDMFKADQSLCEEALNDPSSKIGTVAVAAARSGDREADRSDRARNEVRLGAGFWQRVVDLAMDGLFSRTPLERAQLLHALGKMCYHPGTRKLAQLVDAATTAVEAMDPASVAFCIHGMAALDVTPLPEEVLDAAWRKLPGMNRMESIKTAYSLILGRESLRDSRVLDTLAHALAIRSECPVDMQFQEAIAAHCGVTFEPACNSPVIRKESSAPKPSAGQNEVGQALTMMRVPHRVEVDVGVGGYSIDMLISPTVSKQSFPYYDQFVFCDGTLQWAQKTFFHDLPGNGVLSARLLRVIATRGVRTEGQEHAEKGHTIPRE
ncbi:hypothetical protein FOZ60_000871 [Perkinsus olseni]|uniref:RAP domain-containing protein n=1 Tax=Perkinsus olseni TaxID=32597 RepID=A0A7J6PJS3_PEROL|nr:hypothetical protein FOZ60_000871 [Perkinsus olseni]